MKVQVFQKVRNQSPWRFKTVLWT